MAKKLNKFSDCKSWWMAWRQRRQANSSYIKAIDLETVRCELPDLFNREEFVRRLERLGTRRMRRLARLNVKTKLPKHLSSLGRLGASLSFFGRLKGKIGKK